MTNSASINIDASSSIVPSPGSSIIFFLIITTIYFFIKIFTLPKKLIAQGGFTNIIHMVLFLSILVIGNFFINIAVTQKLCDNNVQWYSTFIITFIPWVLIFGIINIILIVFPGWLIPFSNTIGYFAAKIAGLNSLFVNEILRPELDDAEIEAIGDKTDISVAKALEQIYGNETLLINEIPRDGESEKDQINQFKRFIDIMQKIKLFKENIEDEHIAALYRMLKIKDLTAEYIWNILCGFLVTSLSYNYIVNAGCTYSSGQMKKKYEQHLNTVAEQ